MDSSREIQVAKLLVLYYSEFGYVAIVAHAIADGARSAGAIVDLKRVLEIAAAAIHPGAHFDQVHDDPIAAIHDLPHYDAIIVGSPTRYGRLTSPVAAFLDQASELGSQGILNGKVGGAFASPTSRNGGQESTAMSIITNLLHLGMIAVGPPYSATALSDDAGQRHPSAFDLEGARQQGRLIAQTAQKLWGHAESGAAEITAAVTSAAAAPSTVVN